MNEEVMAHWGLLRQKKNQGFINDVYILEVCHHGCVCENWKGYVVKHSYVS